MSAQVRASATTPPSDPPAGTTMADQRPTPPPAPQYEGQGADAPERPMRGKKAAAQGQGKKRGREGDRRQLGISPYVKAIDKELPLTSLLIDTDCTKGQIRSLDLARVKEIETGVRTTLDTMEVKQATVWEADTVGMAPMAPWSAPLRA